MTALRRDRIGFVFQSFNLVPTLTALENITLPIAIAGRQPDERVAAAPVIDTLGLRDRLDAPARPSCPAGSSSGSRWDGRWPAVRRSSSATSRPATSTRAAAARCCGILRASVDELGQTVVIVTHDPHAAGYADRVLFLADGRIVDEMRSPHRRPRSSTEP